MHAHTVSTEHLASNLYEARVDCRVMLLCYYAVMQGTLWLSQQIFRCRIFESTWDGENSAEKYLFCTWRYVIILGYLSRAFGACFCLFVGAWIWEGCVLCSFRSFELINALISLLLESWEVEWCGDGKWDRLNWLGSSCVYLLWESLKAPDNLQKIT